MLDVAAVGFTLVAADARLSARLATVSRLDLAALPRWLFLALALHDLGKFAPAFQAKQPELFKRRFTADDFPEGPDQGHDLDGLILWHTAYRKDERLLEAFCSAAAGSAQRHRRAAVSSWVSSAVCHHGRPRDLHGQSAVDRFPDRHRADIEGFIGPKSKD
jgi:CRISPR-associated endonuclease/helicase Cas3